MNWRIVHVGKPSFSWVRQGLETYEKRLRGFDPVERRVIKQGGEDAFAAAAGIGPLVCLDEKGDLPSTLEVAETVREWRLDGVRDVTVCIGGADGLPGALVRRADRVWSLGRMTLMHELALLVWMEQLYRVYTVLNHHPYHREG